MLLTVKSADRMNAIRPSIVMTYTTETHAHTHRVTTDLVVIINPRVTSYRLTDRQTD